ncbi:MAG: head decoration protein [Proteobacteria bacterium]|nr:head decoration protein [Pseudomonadota bacterium]
MTTLTEGTHAGEFLVSECDEGTISRETVTILSGSGVITAGMVLGQITKAGTAAAVAFAGNTGTGTVGAITVGAAAIPGAYKLTIIEPAANAGTFTLENPNGVTVGTGTVAVAFSGGGLGFTVSDATDFVAGDGFTITVAAGSLKYQPYDDDNTDGSDTATCIAYSEVDATSADQTCVVIARMAEVRLTGLQWAATNDATDITNGLADLATKNIIAR